MPHQRSFILMLHIESVPPLSNARAHTHTHHTRCAKDVYLYQSKQILTELNPINIGEVVWALTLSEQRLSHIGNYIYL